MVTASYKIRIRGKVGNSVLSSFDDMKAAIRPAETVLRGQIADQAQLHGLLERIQLLGLELIEVRQMPGDEATEPSRDGRRSHLPAPGASAVAAPSVVTTETATPTTG
jgi:hypothetical protein